MPRHSVVSPSEPITRGGNQLEGAKEVEKKEDATKIMCQEDKPMIAPLEDQQEELDEDMVWNATWEPEIYGQPEARAPQGIREPFLPHPREVAIHNRSHNPYRSWCPICVAAAGREDAHRAGARDVEGDNQVPTIGFDYDFFGDSGERVAEEAFEKSTDVTALIMKDYKSGSIWAHMALCKGPTDTWLMRRMTLDIENAECRPCTYPTEKMRSSRGDLRRGAQSQFILLRMIHWPMGTSKT